jgi:hypothetical protein
MFCHCLQFKYNVIYNSFLLQYNLLRGTMIVSLHIILIYLTLIINSTQIDESSVFKHCHEKRRHT